MNHTSNNKTRVLTLSALMAAMTCVATMLIQIPSPGQGYVNLGDCIVNISAWLLGPLFGAAAAGIGSALADIISGYAVFAPATLVIKALMAVVSFHVFKTVEKHLNRTFPARIIAAVSAEIVMTAGYVLYETFLYGSFAAAVSGAYGDLVQGFMGVISSVAIYELIVKRIPKNI